MIYSFYKIKSLTRHWHMTIDQLYVAPDLKRVSRVKQ